MRKVMIAALGAATMLFAFPATAQDFPVTGGDYWTVAEITIDDGHFGDYADHLAGLYRKSIDFQKSKGWIKASYVLSNVNKRDGEPDLYLVTIADRPTTPAEDDAAREGNECILAVERAPVRRAKWGTCEISPSGRQHASSGTGLQEIVTRPYKARGPGKELPRAPGLTACALFLHAEVGNGWKANIRQPARRRKRQSVLPMPLRLKHQLVLRMVIVIPSGMVPVKFPFASGLVNV